MKKFFAYLTVLFTLSCVTIAGDGPNFSESGASFTPLGVPEIGIYDMTADGATMVGIDMWTWEQIIWTEAGGVVNIGGLSYGGGPAISSDGTVITGNAIDDSGNSSAAIWLGGTDWQTLGTFGSGQPCGTSLSSSYDVSADGSILVGLGYDTCTIAHAFRWEESTGMVDLGSTVPGQNSRANRISDDGSVIVGWQETEYGFWQGAYWDADGVQHLFFDANTGAMVGEAYAVSGDGSVIVGGGAGDFNDQAWRWTAETGVQAIGNLPGGWFPMAYAQDVSDDGSVVIGQNGEFFANDAFIWTTETGIVAIADYLTDLGVTAHQGWLLDGAYLVSGDGSMIVGWGYNTDWQYENWIVRLPRPLDVPLDIKPGACPNPLNLKSQGKLPVAILGTEDFDVTNVDNWSITISRADGATGSVGTHIKPNGSLMGNFEDVAAPYDGDPCGCHEDGPDGYLDLVIHFKTQDLVESLALDTVPCDAEVELKVTGTLYDGQEIQAFDCVKVKGNKKPAGKNQSE